MSDTPPLHPALEPLAALLGTWRGEGDGEYPTIEPFAYGEEVVFGHVGKPFLAYRQRTWSRSTGQPLHAETGYWRMGDHDSVEVVISHPFGAVEVYSGTAEPAAPLTLRLATRQVATTPTAKRIDAVERDLALHGAALTYAVRMAAVDQPMTHHLSATLHRCDD